MQSRNHINRKQWQSSILQLMHTLATCTMCFRVNANGSADGEGTHVSVLVICSSHEARETMMTPCQSWPFTGTVKIELLNQLEDKNHHKGTFTFRFVYMINIIDPYAYNVTLYTLSRWQRCNKSQSLSCYYYMVTWSRRHAWFGKGHRDKTQESCVLCKAARPTRYHAITLLYSYFSIETKSIA